MFIDPIAILNFFDQIDVPKAFELSANIGISNPHNREIALFSCLNDHGLDFFTAELMLVSFCYKQCMEDIHYNISRISRLQQSCGKAEFSNQLALFKLDRF